MGTTAGFGTGVFPVIVANQVLDEGADMPQAKVAVVIHRRGPWCSLEVVEFATLEWVDWFNNRRLFEPIGNIPPVENEQAYYQGLEAPAMAAGLN